MKKLISMTLVALMVVFTMTGCKKSYTIIVKSNNDAWGTVTGSGTYKESETVTIAAVPAEGCEFISWNDSNVTNPRQVVVNGNIGYMAVFRDTLGDIIIHNAVTDIDGNQYDAVKIGSQVWMAENLRTTHYADGTSIPAGGDNISYTEPYYYDYLSSGIALSNRGYLYNWPAAMHGAASSNANPSGVQGVCPNGWHLPSDAEWTQLTGYVGSQSEYTCGGNSSYIAKALASETGWNSSISTCAVGNDQTSNNATGFSAVPAGYCYGSSFYNAGSYAIFWSSTESSSGYASNRYLSYANAGVGRYSDNKNRGFSVRCLRD